LEKRREKNGKPKLIEKEGGKKNKTIILEKPSFTVLYSENRNRSNFKRKISEPMCWC